MWWREKDLPEEHNVYVYLFKDLFNLCAWVLYLHGYMYCLSMPDAIRGCKKAFIFLICDLQKAVNQQMSAGNWTQFFCKRFNCSTHSVDQASLELRDPPASASQMLGLETGTNHHTQQGSFLLLRAPRCRCPIYHTLQSMLNSARPVLGHLFLYCEFHLSRRLCGTRNFLLCNMKLFKNWVN